MAAAGGSEFLVQAAVYLGATAVAVPVFKRLKLGTILGFLSAGVLLGPSALGLLQAEEGVFQIAELGVVLLLFVIGLELSVPRLWSLRKTIFGLGLLQMLITGLAIGFGFIIFGLLTSGPGLIAGFALACSSTAFALSLLDERGELNTPYGTKAFSILLFQDIAVIPLLAAIPFVALSSSSGQGLPIDAFAILRSALVIVVVIVAGRYVLNPFFRLVAVSGSREAFTAAALFVVATTALLLAGAGLSMALGAFIAGVLLAESSFRHQIESDIDPFRELLLGLFFIGVGMQLDLGVMLSAWAIVLLGAAGLIIFKMIVIYGLALGFGANRPQALRTAGMLSQGGEFGFVVFSLGAGSGIFSSELATVISAIITLSMVATPVIMMLITRSRPQEVGEVPEVPEGIKNDVLVVGYGRIGQIVSQMLKASGVSVTAIDNDPNRIETARQFGAKVYFGDGLNIRLLLTAGATSARSVIFCVKDPVRLKDTIAALRERCPKLKIIVRATDRLHAIDLLDEDVDLVVRETFESSIKMASRTLGYLGMSDAMIADIEAEFRDRDKSRMLAQKAEGIYASVDLLDKPFSATMKDDERKKESA
ncbi:MAG: monovalent cation:proton antiporter-2 (CPA2) family protein [Pseudomonadota bacterium]